MDTDQYYSQVYTISKDFLKWIYAHPQSSQGLSKDLSDYLWQNKADTQEFVFGGKNGTQFRTEEDITSFNEEFDKILQEYNIGHEHKANLLYCIIFLNQDFEAQSLKNNLHNRLLDYARFILDIVATCQAHYNAMVKNDEYQCIFDEETLGHIFVRKYLLKTLSKEEIIYTIPATKRPDDIVRYYQFLIYDLPILLPPNLKFTLGSDQNKDIKTFSGETVSHIAVPSYYQSILFEHTVNEMLKAHKDNNTQFYQQLTADNANLGDLKKIYNSYKKRSISQEISLMKVGILISDYLKENGLIEKKSHTANFLFKYFALTKAYTKTFKEQIPTEYSDLYTFYIREGIKPESVRMMMKDAEKFRGNLL